MFGRFTEQARQVVVLAQEEARLLHHNYIGTEHLLLGLLREADGLAARVLESLDISLDRVRSSAQQEGQRQIEAVRQAKEQAIEAKQFDSAAQLRDQERALREHARAESEVRIDEALDSIRRRLGIPSSSGDPPPGHRASQDEPD